MKSLRRNLTWVLLYGVFAIASPIIYAGDKGKGGGNSNSRGGGDHSPGGNGHSKNESAPNIAPANTGTVRGPNFGDAPSARPPMREKAPSIPANVIQPHSNSRIAAPHSSNGGPGLERGIGNAHLAPPAPNGSNGISKDAIKLGNQNRFGSNQIPKLNSGIHTTTLQKPIIDNSWSLKHSEGSNRISNSPSNRASNAFVNKDWKHWQNNWNQYGVAGYNQNWYRGSWTGFNNYYLPGGLGYGLGYSGLGGYGYGAGNYGYGYQGGSGTGILPFLINSLAYRWGYNNFYNPYYGNNGGSAYNYSQPVYVLNYQNIGLENVQLGSVQSDFGTARNAFRQQDYNTSIAYLERVIQTSPSDSLAHEFLALNYFALGRYEESAAVLNSVLAVAPGWNWETQVSLYADVSIYTEQLRRLETYVRDHANDAASNLVLAYHYLVINHPQAAKAKLERVLELQPRDQVARQLLTGIVGTEQNGVPPPDESMLSNQPTEKFQADLTGTWGTTRNGAPIHLSFQPNGEFTWSVGSGDQAHTITGRYSVNSGTLVMIDGQGEAMTAHVIALSPDTFHFSMVGAPQEDPGVKFERRF